MFQKLKEAYTKARYSKHYRISEGTDLARRARRGTRPSRPSGVHRQDCRT
jgi:hypothetical protein